MINVDMISTIRRYHWKAYGLVVGLLLFIAASLFILIPRTHAAGGVGSGGNPGSSTGTYHTSNGFGWRKYNATSSSAPSEVAAMTTGSWTDVYTACRDVGQVWMFMIFARGQGTGKQYAMNASGGGIIYLEPNPGTWDGRFYRTYFDGRLTNGVYYGTNYIGNASENTVHGYFNTAVSSGIIDPGTLRYGSSIGWFCYSDNPPWTIGVATTVDKTIAEPGERITWTHTLTNTGSNTTNKAITWRYKSQGAISGNGTDWTWATGRPSGTNTANNSTYDVQPADIGKTVCRSASAEPSTNISNATIESSSICVVIAKKPKVQIIGSDLIVGRSFSGSAATSGTTTSITSKIPPAVGTAGYVFGSWVEYGIFATGTINGTGSGSAFGATGGRSTQKCDYSLLSFVNARAAPTGRGLPTACTTTTTVGQYSTVRNLPDIGTNFPSAGAPVYANDPSSQGIYTSRDQGTSPVVSDPITISAKTLQKGQWVVINAPNADVTISGNIDYTSATLQSVSEIPQMIIIAKNIRITENVTNIDAWLIAKGTTSGTGIIDTCWGASRPTYNAPLTTATCRDKLQVNGPVIANALWLRRTAGAGVDSTAPAEVFNLRPDAYMWLYARASTSGRVQTVYTKELPPRF